MPLTADQQAMLQLLLERGQRYADLASVLGVDEAEVRSRARGALTELAGADPDRNVGLTDYLLGQADPIGRADSVRHLKDDPEDLSLATELSQKLLLVAPEANLPRLPGEERRPRPQRSSQTPLLGRLRRAGSSPPAAERSTPRSRTSLSRRQAQLIVGLGCAAVLLVVVIVAVAVGFGGGGNDNGTTTGSTTAAGTQNLATVELKPQANTNASGTVSFGLENGQQAFVDVGLKGLQPAPAGQTYVIWLLLTPGKGYPLSPIRTCGTNVPEPCLSRTGSYENRFQLPSPTLAIVSRTQFVDISVAPTNAVRNGIKTAIKQKQLIIRRPGTSVLRGGIPKGSGSKGSGTSNHG